MIKLLVADIGGVLVKTDEAIVWSIEQAFKNKNIPPGSKEKMLEAFGISIFDYIKSYLPKQHKGNAEEVYREFQKIYPDKAIHLFQVFEGVEETLQKLKEKGIKVALISCMRRKEVEANLSLLKFKDFEAVLAIEDYENKRPHPDALNKVLDELNVDANNAIYVGDAVSDIQMAKNAGVKSFAVKSGLPSNESLKKANPDWFFSSFKDVVKII